MRLLIIHNPTAGSGGREQYWSVLNRLECSGCQLSVCDTEHPRHATQLAKQAGSFDRVVVVGGDGTVNEVINGLVELPDAPSLAIIPLGTSNVLAAEIGMPSRAAQIAEVIQSGQSVPITLGKVNDRLFAVMSGAGMDAHLVAGVRLDLKKRVGAAAYAMSFLKQVKDFEFPEYQLTINDQVHVVGSVIVANASRYAPFWVIAPRADLRHAALDVCHVPSPGNWGRVRTAVALFGGRLAEGRGLTIDQCEQVTISGPPGEPVQADGEIVTRLPAEITTVRSALHLMYPR